MTIKVPYRDWLYDEIADEAMLNEQIRDNGNALWTYTTKGDIAAAIASDELTRLPVGANGLFVKADSAEASGLRYGGPIRAIQNGGTFVTAGTTNSYPQNTYIQAGLTSLTWSSSTDASTTVTWPVAYSTFPLIYLSFMDTTIGYACALSSQVFNSGISAQVFGKAPSSISATYKICWMTIGLI
jgi:hypothetical protein